MNLRPSGYEHPPRSLPGYVFLSERDVTPFRNAVNLANLPGFCLPLARDWPEGGEAVGRPRKIKDGSPVTNEEALYVVRAVLELVARVRLEELRGRTTAGQDDRDAVHALREQLEWVNARVPTAARAVTAQSKWVREIARLGRDFDALCDYAAAEPATPERDRVLVSELAAAVKREAADLGIEERHVAAALEDVRLRNRLDSSGRVASDWLRGGKKNQRSTVEFTSALLLRTTLEFGGLGKPARSTTDKYLKDVVDADAADMVRTVQESETIALVLTALGVPPTEIPWVGSRLAGLLNAHRRPGAVPVFPVVGIDRAAVVERTRRYIASTRLEARTAALRRVTASAAAEVASAKRLARIAGVDKSKLPAVMRAAKNAAIKASGIAARHLPRFEASRHEAEALCRPHLPGPTEFAYQDVPAGGLWAPPENPWGRSAAMTPVTDKPGTAVTIVPSAQVRAKNAKRKPGGRIQKPKRDG